MWACGCLTLIQLLTYIRPVKVSSCLSLIHHQIQLLLACDFISLSNGMRHIRETGVTEGVAEDATTDWDIVVKRMSTYFTILWHIYFARPPPPQPRPIGPQELHFPLCLIIIWNKNLRDIHPLSWSTFINSCRGCGIRIWSETLFNHKWKNLSPDNVIVFTLTELWGAVNIWRVSQWQNRDTSLSSLLVLIRTTTSDNTGGIISAFSNRLSEPNNSHSFCSSCD